MGVGTAWEPEWSTVVESQHLHGRGERMKYARNDIEESTFGADYIFQSSRLPGCRRDIQVSDWPCLRAPHGLQGDVELDKLQHVMKRNGLPLKRLHRPGEVASGQGQSTTSWAAVSAGESENVSKEFERQPLLSVCMHAFAQGGVKQSYVVSPEVLTYKQRLCYQIYTRRSHMRLLWCMGRTSHG